MKLFYFQAPEGNVGDDLNRWLWPKLLRPDLIDEDEQNLLIGIGTLLNHKIPPAQKYTVLTSGVGYGQLPNLGEGKWDFLGLRGELSKKALNITKPVCLLDGAYLLPRFLDVKVEKKYKIAYIPHVDSMINGQWNMVCQLAGIKLIDPRWDVDLFVRELCSCEKVLTEAMHGAILADAYGIPWSPVKAYDYISDFKWNDWASSLDLDYKFNILPSTWCGDQGKPIVRRVINTVKRVSEKSGFFPATWTPVQPAASSKVHILKVTKIISGLVYKANYHLSNDSLKRERTDLLMEVITNKFK